MPVKKKRLSLVERLRHKIAGEKPPKRPREYSLEPVYYVYALVDPRNDETFYVGKGKGDRAYHHMRRHSLVAGYNSAKCARILQIIEDGCLVRVLRLADGLTEREAYRRERKEIRLARIQYAEAVTNASGGRNDELERCLYQIKWLIAHSKPLRQWLLDWARFHNRLPTMEDAKLYQEIMLGHIQIRDWIVAKMDEKARAVA